MAKTWTQVRADHNNTVPQCACVICCLGTAAQIGARQMAEPLGVVLSDDWYKAFYDAPPQMPTSQDVED